MTGQYNQELNNSDVESKSSNPQPPEILSEVDIPFNGSQIPTLPSNLSKTSSLDEEVTRFKYITGRKVLWVSMGAMGVSVIISIILSLLKLEVENSLLENSFEVFKLIAMTVLGYIFGSKSQ